MNEYLILCKPSCNYCTTAANLLEDRCRSYQRYDFDSDNEELLEVLSVFMSYFNHHTVPLVIRRSSEQHFEFIGGCSDLIEYLNKGEDAIERSDSEC